MLLKYKLEYTSYRETIRVLFYTGFKYKNAIGKVIPCGSLREDISSSSDGAVVDEFKKKKRAVWLRISYKFIKGKDGTN